MNFDIAIIGGGPAGYNAAAMAAGHGLKTILFEKNKVGGVCLNEGCIPTKALLHSANLYDEMCDSSKYGIKVEGELSADYKRIAARKTKIVKKLTAGVAMKLEAAGVTTVNAVATLAGEEGDLIRIVAGEDTYTAKHILIATGSETVIPPIKGIDTVEYWTSREALDAKELPADIVIIGGGVIGMEFASIFTSMGVPVTVVEMMPEILGAMDKETSAMLREEYEKKGVKFYLNTKVTEVSPTSVTVERQDGSVEAIAASRILLSVGRRPVSEGLGLETLAIEMNRNAVIVNQYMQTSHPRVYAAGDITGFSLLAHTAIREGEVAINHIVGGADDPMSYSAIPGVVYTHPEIAGVGRTEEDLKAKGESYRVLRLGMAYAGRFVVENEGGNGLCKIIVDDDDTVIGCHMIGNPASELIMLAGIAIADGSKVEEFRRHVFPHPTVGEIIHEVLFHG